MTVAIDISNNNGVVDLMYCGSAGVRIVVAKASEGVNFHDDFYLQNLRQAYRHGLKFGAYHFARPSANTGAEEAAYFLSQIVGPGTPACVVLDLEDTRVDPGAGLAAFAIDWFEHVREQYAGSIYLYTSHGYAINHGIAHEVAAAGFSLWLASWSVTEPLQLPGWDQLGAWQYTDEGFVPGIGRVDMSLWYDLI
jgi:lysozyme